MANVSYTPAAFQAYLAGRTLARSSFQSLDPQRVEVPAEFAAYASAYRDGVADQQSGAPDPSVSAPPKQQDPSPGAAPPAPSPKLPQRPPAPPVQSSGGDDARQKTEDEFRRVYGLLDGQPLQVVRQLAIDQIVRIDKAFADAPLGYRLSRIRYGSASQRLDLARKNLESADALANAGGTDSTAERLRLYKLAYELSFYAGQELATALGDQSFLISGLATAARGIGSFYKDTGKAVLHSGEVVVNKVADTYAGAGKELLKAGGQVAGAGGEALKGIGGTARTAVYVIAGGGALALVTYGLVRAYQSRPAKR